MSNVSAGVRLVVMAVAAAIAYGVAHDQVTARICVEYFTIGHPPVFDTTDPTLLGLGWGVIATWWVGLLLGAPLALAARAGTWPVLPPSSLVRPIGVLLACMATCAVVAGVVGYLCARCGAVDLVGPLAERVPSERHHAFIAVLWAHVASYATGFVGGACVIGWTLRARRRWGLAQRLA